MIGTVVGNYKVVEKIGEGGMGAVFRGIDLMLEREVAIKVLKPELASQPQVVERFRSEAVTLAKLNHPNIATLFSFFRQGDYFFMVLEYVNGVPRDKIIESNGVMTCEQAIPLFGQMLEGIDHAHRFGVIHRDIKPGNMMLTNGGLLKVLDFGIARALGTARMTRAGHLIGTIEYMSPEQVRGMETDARSDIYSLGMVLYEMLTGRVPFASDSEFELMKAQVEQLPTPPREFAPSIPEDVESAILCATEKDPNDRFQTAGAFGEAIANSVVTAVATGALSPIDMRTPGAGLGGSFARISAPGVRVSSDSRLSQSDRSSTGELLRGSTETQKLPPATRIADRSELAAPASPLRMTRLGEPASETLDLAVPMDSASNQESKPPFFSILNKKHYAIGGAVLGVLFLGFVVVVVTLFLGRSSNGAENGSSATPGEVPAAEKGSTDNVPATEPAERSQPEAPVESTAAESTSQTVKEVPAVEDIPSSSTSPPAPGKNSRAPAPARKKPRRSARDIMEAP